MVVTFERPSIYPAGHGPASVSVMSARDAAHLFGPRGHGCCDAMVGIKSPGYRFPPIDHTRVGRLLRLAFFDTTPPDPKAMRPTDAAAIVSFVRTLPPDATLVIHCEGGVSRSAGIASALMDALWGDGEGDVVWCHPHLAPNEHCWSLVREAAGLRTRRSNVKHHVRMSLEHFED